VAHNNAESHTEHLLHRDTVHSSLQFLQASSG